MAYTRNWSFTWETNIKQKRLPPLSKVKAFLDYNASEAVFQIERGASKRKKHYQGMLTLAGSRTSKTEVLKLFAGQFKNTSGLTLSPVFDKLALSKYVTKEGTRESGPYFCGREELFDQDFAAMELRPWQKQLYDGLLSEEAQELIGRHVITVHNTSGGAGKSRFTKWLRVGQKKLRMRKLPFASVQQLNSAICKLTRKSELDLVVIDLTRVKGHDQHFSDLFSVLEDITGGYTVDSMYGNYTEALYKPPQVLIFTNYEFKEIYPYMSNDRWIPFQLNAFQQLSHIFHVNGELDYVVPYRAINYTNKK